MDEKTKKLILIFFVCIAGIVIVVAALQLGIVLSVLAIIQSPGAAQQCIFQEPGLSCDQPDVPTVGTDGALKGTLVNGFKSTIVVYGIRCVSDNAPQTFSATGVTGSEIPPVSSAKFQDMVNGVACGESGGNPGGSTTSVKAYAKGTTFKGKIWVFYRYKDDMLAPDKYRTATANLVASVV